MSELTLFLKSQISKCHHSETLDALSDIITEYLTEESLTADEVGTLQEQITAKRITICQIEQAK